MSDRSPARPEDALSEALAFMEHNTVYVGSEDYAHQDWCRRCKAEAALAVLLAEREERDTAALVRERLTEAKP